MLSTANGRDLTVGEPVRRIAILGSRGFPSTYSGYETAVRHIAPDWVSRGIDVTVYCRERNKGLRSWNENGVRCRWSPGVETKTLSTLTFGLTSHLNAARRPYDAALVLNIANGFFLPVLKGAGIGTVVNTDGIEWERGKWGTAARRVFFAGAKASAKYADVLVSDSRGIADIWRKTFGVESEYIPYGAPVIESVGDSRVLAEGIEPGKYALVVARLIPENNIDLTLDALEEGNPFPLVVVGDANYASPIESRLNRLHSRGAIRWLGHVSDQVLLTQLWANAGVCVHGHSVGGTNPSLLQALGAGAPTIALDTVFNREVLGNDEQLYPQDSDILGMLIRKILSDANLRSEWSRQGKKIVATRFRWSDVSDRYLQALELAKSRRGA